MGNKTECTGFLARTTIKPETKAGLDKTESIMVRRPSLKWNFHAGLEQELAWKSIYYVRPARLFIFHFLLLNQAPIREHSLSYLRSQISLDAENFLCAQVRLASSPPFSVLGNKETRNQKERREIGPCFPREATFSQASSRLEVEDCSMRASLFPGLCSPVYAPTQKVIIFKMKRVNQDLDGSLSFSLSG